MKRLIVALLVGGALFTVAFAAAAGLGVTSGGLQTGASADVICDTDGVAVTYQDTDTNGTYDQATVSDVDCTGTYDITVEVHNAGHGTLASGTAFGASGPGPQVTLTDELTPAEILPAHHVHVTIVSTG